MQSQAVKRQGLRTTLQKSDSFIVAMMRAMTAERRELRRVTYQRETSETQEVGKQMETLTEVIRSLSMKYSRVENLMRCITVKSLKHAHEMQPANKAMGIDKVTKAEYGEHLDVNLEKLIAAMKTFSYRPLAVRRTYIPKANGKLRPLGIPSYEDRLVQYVMAEILNGIYEPRFLDCSYGFREGRSCHQVVKVIDNTVFKEDVNYVLEADIKGFFDNVNHDWLMKFLEHDIADQNFLRYIKRFLIGGVMEDGKLLASVRGTPQGGLISPVLANVYLHYVLDLWWEKAIQPALKGYAKYVRYADDFLILFEREDEAETVMKMLPERLGKFDLEVAVDKTRVLPFGRNDKGRNNFDFLGFTFYESKTRTGGYKVGIKSSEKKLKMKRQELKKWFRTRLILDSHETMLSLNRKLTGHCNYYGVNGNLKSLLKFYRYAKRQAYWMFNRQSQKAKMTWDKMDKIWKEYISPPKIRVQIWC